MTEAQEQRVVVEYLEHLRLPFFHIPNERKCTPQQGAYLKKMGVKSGVPDLCIPIPMGGYHALYIEMKSKSGRTSVNQRKWIKTLRQYGNCAEVCYGADQAMELIRGYIKGEIVTPV